MPPDSSGPFPPRVAMDPTLLVGRSDDELLCSYLELVRGWRGTNDRTALRLRQADVLVLVGILGTDSAEIERRLIAATTCTASAARRCRRLLLASLTTLSVGIIAAGVVGRPTSTGGPAPGVQRRESVFRPASVVAVAPPVEAPVVTASAVAAEVAIPAPSAGTELALPEVEAIVDIPSLGIDLPVVEGGQSVIDEGIAAHYTAPGWEPPVDAGESGTYWLAAHHETHGAPFAGLSDIDVGAEVRVTANGRTFVYTVTAKEVVGLLPGDAAVYGTDPTAAVILLQTCVDEAHRLLVHGTLTATI